MAKHTIRPGDTLLGLAIQYYGTADGVEDLVRRNGYIGVGKRLWSRQELSLHLTDAEIDRLLVNEPNLFTVDVPDGTEYRTELATLGQAGQRGGRPARGIGYMRMDVDARLDPIATQAPGPLAGSQNAVGIFIIAPAIWGITYNAYLNTLNLLVINVGADIGTPVTYPSSRMIRIFGETNLSPEQITHRIYDQDVPATGFHSGHIDTEAGSLRYEIGTHINFLGALPLITGIGRVIVTRVPSLARQIQGVFNLSIRSRPAAFRAAIEAITNKELFALINNDSALDGVAVRAFSIHWERDGVLEVSDWYRPTYRELIEEIRG